MAQNTIQNSSVLYPEDVIVYVAEWSTDYTTAAELSSATWLNLGSLTEFTVESANESVQPGSFNVEHDQVLTKEAENITLVLQELNSSLVQILRGGISQQVSTYVPGGSSSNSAELLYSGGADTITPCMIRSYASYSDGRSRHVYWPKVYYVSGEGIAA